MPINLPNLITVIRILLVPVTVWLIVQGAYMLSFVAFLVAGISDGIDGFIAKRFDLSTELGAYLDPLADKLLLVAIYLSLGVSHHLPSFLVILVVSRDILIVGGLLLAWLVNRPIRIKPLGISKLNTVLQILQAGAVLAVLGFQLDDHGFILVSSVMVGITTIASGAAYISRWLVHMANGDHKGR